MADEQTSDARQDAHDARAHANDLRQQADEAAHAAAEAEARAQAADDGVEYVPADPLAGTWEGAVQADSAAKIGDEDE